MPFISGKVRFQVSFWFHYRIRSTTILDPIDIRLGVDARALMLGGLEEVADVVGVTAGPKVLLEKTL